MQAGGAASRSRRAVALAAAEAGTLPHLRGREGEHAGRPLQANERPGRASSLAQPVRLLFVQAATAQVFGNGLRGAETLAYRLGHGGPAVDQVPGCEDARPSGHEVLVHLH